MDNLVQTEFFKFIMTEEDMPRNTWMDARIRFYTSLEKKFAKWDKIRFVKDHQVIFEEKLVQKEPTDEGPTEYFDRLRKMELEALRNDVPGFLLLEEIPFLDRLAMGDVKAGEELLSSQT